MINLVNYYFLISYNPLILFMKNSKENLRNPDKFIKKGNIDWLSMKIPGN